METERVRGKERGGVEGKKKGLEEEK